MIAREDLEGHCGANWAMEWQERALHNDGQLTPLELGDYTRCKVVRINMVTIVICCFDTARSETLRFTK